MSELDAVKAAQKITDATLRVVWDVMLQEGHAKEEVTKIAAKVEEVLNSEQ